MKFEWKQITIGELGTIITGKTPTTKKSEYWGGKVPFVTPKDLQGTKHIVRTERFITDMGMENVKGSKLPPDAICVSCIGNIGYVGMTTKNCISNQQVNSIIVNQNHDADFIYYLMKSLWTFFKNYEGQSTTLSILNKTQFSRIKIKVPQLKIQKEIAGILSYLDDKIELNNKINDNLEQQAQAIFKSWFVDFEPFEGVAPKEWRNATLEEITELVCRGITPKYSNASDQIVINQKCIRDHRIDLSLARFHIPKAINEKWLQFGDLLINSTGTGTLGRTAQVWFNPKNLTVDSHVTIVRLAKENLIFYIGLWGISHEKEIESLHTGSTGQTELPRERVKAIELLLPDNETLDRFNAIIAPMAATIVSNQKENQSLAELRDALLPKLMSGEIDVEDVKI